MTIKSHAAKKRFVQAIEKYNIAKMERLEAEIDVLDEMFESKPNSLRKIMFLRKVKEEELKEIREEVKQVKENREAEEAKQQELFAMLDDLVQHIESEEDDD